MAGDVHVSDPAVDAALADEVRGFIHRHWLASGRNDAARAAWHQALVTRGWTVPRWPVAHGGSGWSAAAQYLWERETALADTPVPDPVATTLVGPLLIGFATPAQQAGLLNDIRAGAARWCVALSGADEVTVAGRGMLHVTARFEAVAGAADAHWLLAAVDDELILVDLSLPGIRRRRLTTLDGRTDSATVSLENVAVAADRRLAVAGGVAQALRGLAAVPGAWPLRACRLQARLARLREVADGTSGDDAGTLLADSAFAARLTALEIDLAALEGLERRTLAGQADGTWSPALAALTSLRQSELEQRLGLLSRDAVGYYALAFPDPRLIDNEGPIGHDYALAMVTQALGRPGLPLGDVAGAFHKNTIARHLPGL